ncbi:DUF6461 domain-containing protein [Streptomyces boluensis]|uniref:Uncharacterized protein n=1 Tax=Streptomyces boluensis TaxID=1775135 RepID=A0A964USA4_9ACTN|nr:DUF6461 domain-containing protein [Streptomyces boluensis]NBE53536.1 hypothetical protein [Streptomyces boluensis]
MPENPLGWIADAYETHCLTLAQGVTGRELLMRLGCDAGGVTELADEGEASALQEAALASGERRGEQQGEEWGAVHAGVVGGWAYALEPGSAWASIDERLARASRGARVICCVNTGPLSHLFYWEDGSLVTEFDAMAPELRAEQGGQDPDRLVVEMRRVGFFAAEDGTVDDADERELGLALLHEVTGVALSDDVTRAGLAGRIPALYRGPEGPAPEGDEDGPAGDGLVSGAGRPPVDGASLTGTSYGGLAGK